MDIYGDNLYNTSSDEILAEMAANGDEKAVEVLMCRYIAAVKYYSKGYSIPEADKDDLAQEASIAFLEAVRTYNKSKNVPFMSYAAVCMKRKVASVVRCSLKKKNSLLGSILPLDEDIFNDIDFSENPEQIHITNEENFKKRQLIQFLLSDLEKEVLHLYLACVSYDDIAQKLNISVKSVDNALQRIRKKLRSEYRRSNL